MKRTERFSLTTQSKVNLSVEQPSNHQPPCKTCSRQPAAGQHHLVILSTHLPCSSKTHLTKCRVFAVRSRSCFSYHSSLPPLLQHQARIRSSSLLRQHQALRHQPQRSSSNSPTDPRQPLTYSRLSDSSSSRSSCAALSLPPLYSPASLDLLGRSEELV